MEHSDRVKQNLAILGLESLEGLSLLQLSDAVAKSLPSDVTKMRIMNIYFMWLQSRLMAIDISADDIFSQEIANWYKFLKAVPIDDDLIIEALSDWHRNQAAENPTCSRRLSIAEAELRRLITDGPASPKFVLGSDNSDDHYGQMHPDRVRLSQDNPTVIEINDDDDDDIVFVSSNTLRKNETAQQNTAGDGQPDLSFLTGANMLAMNGKPNAPAKKQEKKASKLETRTANPKGEKAGASKKPYRCDRCGETGHNYRLCPTILDPSFDHKPPENYKCHFCEKIGDHFGPLCLKHPDPRSIARQRERHARVRGRADAGRPAEDQGGRRSGRSLRSYDARDRSRSPIREATDRYRGDYFRPEHEFARLHLSSRGRMQKRKASRSPSPHKTVSREKDHPWVTEGVKRSEGVKKSPAVKKTLRAFPDDLMSQRTYQGVGRLSYDDEVDRDALKTSPATRVVHSPDVEMIDIDKPEMPVSDEAKEVENSEDHSLELEVLEMIQAESVKTDLLLLINGIEHVPAACPFILQLFKERENIWINKTIAKARPCPADYFESLVDQGKVEVIDCEMTAVYEPAKGEGQDVMCDKEGQVDTIMTVAEPADSAGTEDRDEEMIDAEFAPAVASAVEVDSAVTSTASPKINEHILQDAHIDQVAAGAIEIPSSDEHSAERITDEAMSMMDEVRDEIVQISTSSTHPSNPEAVDLEPIVLSSSSTRALSPKPVEVEPVALSSSSTQPTSPEAVDIVPIVLSSSSTHPATPVAVDVGPIVLASSSTQPANHEAVDVEPIVLSSSSPVDNSAMDVDMSPVETEDLAATTDCACNSPGSLVDLKVEGVESAAAEEVASPSQDDYQQVAAAESQQADGSAQPGQSVSAVEPSSDTEGQDDHPRESAEATAA